LIINQSAWDWRVLIRFERLVAVEVHDVDSLLIIDFDGIGENPVLVFIRKGYLQLLIAKKAVAHLSFQRGDF